MSKIALYNTLRKIPNVTDDEAKEAMADVVSPKEVANKMDIAELKSDIRELKTEFKYLRLLIVVVAGIVIGIIKFL